VTGGWTVLSFHGWTDGSLIQSTGGTRNHRCPEEIHRMQAVDGGVGVRLWSIFSSFEAQSRLRGIWEAEKHRRIY